MDYPEGAPLAIVRAGKGLSLCMIELENNNQKFSVRGANGELVYECASSWTYE